MMSAYRIATAMLKIKNILLAHDLTSSTDGAVALATQLARTTGATLHVVFADILYGAGADQAAHLSAGLAAGTDPSERLRAAVGLDPLPLETRYAVVRGIAPAPALLDYALSHEMDLIVMGTHGRRGLRRLMLGSVAEEVVRHAPCPVLTVPQHGGVKEDAVREILVPIDFSEHAFRALVHARALAESLQARLVLLHVVEDKLHPAFYGPALQSIYDVDPLIEEKAVAHLKREFEHAGGREGEADFVARYGVAPGVILDVAEARGVGLVVMGTHGLTALERFFVGSVTDKVVRAAPCPVFTVRSFGKMLVGAHALDKAASPHP